MIHIHSIHSTGLGTAPRKAFISASVRRCCLRGILPHSSLSCQVSFWATCGFHIPRGGSSHASAAKCQASHARMPGGVHPALAPTIGGGLTFSLGSWTSRVLVDRLGIPARSFCATAFEFGVSPPALHGLERQNPCGVQRFAYWTQAATCAPRPERNSRCWDTHNFIVS